MNLLQQDASYRHYEEVVSAVVRNPGDGQQTEDDNDLIVLPANEANMKKDPKSLQDQVKAGSSGITPFKGTTCFFKKLILMLIIIQENEAKSCKGGRKSMTKEI